MQVLVTGATGQLGGAVAAALLARGDRVRVIARDPARAGALTALGCEVVAGDVTAPQSLPAAMAGQEAVIHTAGVVSYWSRRAAEQHAVNVVGTANVLDAAAAAGVRRVLLTSSIATLGWVPEGEEGDEDTAWNWQGMGNAYFETKKASEDLVLGERRLEGLAVNPGIVFGPGDVHHNGLRMLTNVADGRARGAPPGATTVAVLDDVVAGHLAALDRGLAGRRYVLGGTTLPFRELFARIGAVVGRAPPDRVIAPWQIRLTARLVTLGSAFTGKEPWLTPTLAEMLLRNRRYRSDRAARELGLRFSPLEAGLTALWAWHRDRLARSTELA